MLNRTPTDMIIDRQSGQKLSDRLAQISLIPVLKTSIEDSNYDNLKAINDAIFSIKDVGGTVYIPNRGDVYLIDPSKFNASGHGIILYPNIKLVSNGATLKLKNTAYTQHLKFICTRNYVNGAYDAAIAITENVSIEGLTIDGNTDNLSNTNSVTGINAYKVKNFTVKNCKVQNLSGNTGNGYGIITWYSENITLENIVSGVTDRQNICIWETQKAKLKNIISENSGFREPILISTNTPHTFQKTEAFCDNIYSKNTGTGTYALRVAGNTDAVIVNSKFESDGSLKCVYIPNGTTLVTNVTFRNCQFINGSYGIHADGSAEKNITIESCLVSGCGTGISISGVAGKGSARISDTKILTTTGNPLSVSYFSNIVLKDNLIDTFNTGNLLIANFNFAQVRGNRIINGLGLTNTIVINSDGTLTETLHYLDNVLKSNNINKVRILTNGVVIGNIGTIDSTSIQVNQFNS